MSEGDARRAVRLREIMNDYMRNRSPAERDRQMQLWMAQAMTHQQRCAATRELMNFAIACRQRQMPEAAHEQSV